MTICPRIYEVKIRVAGPHAAVAPEGVVMTVTAGRRSASRASRPGPAQAETVEQPTRADRAAQGKDARAAAPLESHAEFTPGGSRDPGGLLLSQALPGAWGHSRRKQRPSPYRSLAKARGVHTFYGGQQPS